MLTPRPSPRRGHSQPRASTGSRRALTSPWWLAFAHATVALTAIACGGGGGGGGSTSGSGGHAGALPTFDYPRDGVLRLNHLQAKGTHNSYHVPSADAKSLKALDYTHQPLGVQLATQGVRQIELDTHYNEAKGAMEVYHLYLADEGTSCRLLSECLGAVKTWSDAHPAHHPVFVQIEPKDAPSTAAEAEAYFAKLEGEVLAVFPRGRVLTPDDVRGAASSLPDAIAKDGWPTLGEARGKVAFFIDNHEDLRGFYTHGGQDLAGRLMFIDAEPADPWAGIILVNDPVANADKIVDALARGLMVRTRADADNVEPFAGDTTKRDAALASGAHFISTDYPAPVPGVPDAGAPYVVEIPGGQPSRCNPVTAPAACAATDIEDPAFMGP